MTSKKALTGFYTCNQMVRYDPICKDYNLKVFKFHFIISYEMSTSPPKQEYKVDQNAILYNFWNWQWSSFDKRPSLWLLPPLQKSNWLVNHILHPWNFQPSFAIEKIAFLCWIFFSMFIDNKTKIVLNLKNLN